MPVPEKNISRKDMGGKGAADKEMGLHSLLSSKAPEFT